MDESSILSFKQNKKNISDSQYLHKEQTHNIPIGKGKYMAEGNRVYREFWKEK